MIVLALLVCLFGVSLADITGTDPPSGSCLCVKGTSVNVRGTACGTVIGSTNQGVCYRGKGIKEGCTLSGTFYEFFNFDYNGQDGWLAGTYFTHEDESVCGGGGGDGDQICWGDLTLLSPTGASAATASQDGLSYTGVPASNTLVTNDYNELNLRKHCYDQVGEKYCIEPALIAAIASRESRGGRLLYATGGWGDNYNAYGILQCDINTSGLGSCCTSHSWDSCEHMDMMIAEVFIDKIECVQQKHPTWLKERQLQGGVAAYNFGCSNVWTWEGLDQGTTGNDYSNDVMARAQYMKNYYGW